MGSFLDTSPFLIYFVSLVPPRSAPPRFGSVFPVAVAVSLPSDRSAFFVSFVKPSTALSVESTSRTETSKATKLITEHREPEKSLPGLVFGTF
ncbi:hypothetical protein VTH06DRAFT_8337 [Thermothelomyces fergusii]